MNRVLVVLMAGCLFFSLHGCGRPQSLTAQEQATVKALTASLTPRCAGRYLIDVPANAHIFPSVEVERVRVSAQPMPLDDHRLAMQERRGELNAAKSHLGYRFLYADHEVKGIPDSRYFISLGRTAAMTDADRAM